MARTAQPSWVKHILKLLGQAKAKDPDLARFGAYSHQYKLAAPAGEEAIQEFEEQQGIRLPEEYRDFLMLVGNGGAGPYYGLYGLKALKEDLSDSHGGVMEEPVIYPKMSEEEWDRMADPEGRRKGEEVHPYAGILPIGTQGCTLMTGLMLAGPYRGQVVYYDEDFCGPPFFTREKGFLEWYERWLQELYVILLDKYRTHENAKFDYKGSQMVLRGGSCLGASRPEGQLTSNLMRQFDYFGLDYRGGWKLLMDEGRWREWKHQSGFT